MITRKNDHLVRSDRRDLNRMLYADWLKNFEQAQICNLSPDSFEGQLTAQQVFTCSFDL